MSTPTPELPEPGGPPSSGLLGSLREFADFAFGTLKDRLELLAIELQEEKQRWIQNFVWMTALVFFAFLAVLFISATVVVACWNTPARLPVVAGFAGLYLIATVVTGWKLHDRLNRQTRPFAASADELRMDRECLRPKN